MLHMRADLGPGAKESVRSSERDGHVSAACPAVQPALGTGNHVQDRVWRDSMASCRRRCQTRVHLSPCLFNLDIEHIIRKTGLASEEGGGKIGGRNSNNLRCADDIILPAESSNDLKRLLMKGKEENAKAGLAFEHPEDKNQGFRGDAQL